MSHYDWLEENLPTFFNALNIDEDANAGIIGAHGDKCYSYQDAWAERGIPFEHGVAIYLLSYVDPFCKECRETEHDGWVPPDKWVMANYQRFMHLLPRMSTLHELNRLLKENVDRESGGRIELLPITHKHDVVFLQMKGWSIDLKADGTWHITITEGG